MKIKKIYILLIFALLTADTYATTDWQKARISNILPEGEILFGKSQQAQLSGIDYASFNTKDECFRRVILQKLREDWIGLDIHWREEENTILAKNTQLGNLSEYLLKKGMARLDETTISIYYKGKFTAATTQAQEATIGIWKGCSQEEAQRKVRLIREKQHFMELYEGFLSPVSVGKVKRVIEGNLLELENGAKVKLIGLQIPQKDTDELHDCFREQAREFLSSLIKGKTVILRSDRVDFDQNGTLLRYVYLPSWEKNGNEPLINKILIQEGYAKSYWPDKNVKQKDLFESLQSNSYQFPKGAWEYCFGQEFQKHINPSTKPKELIYDENCPIKGNISGTKSSPSKKYHTPASPWYTRITKPEQCFNSEEKAQQAGFIKVR